MILLLLKIGFETLRLKAQSHFPRYHLTTLEGPGNATTFLQEIVATSVTTNK
jgi:hypothetical protein